MKATLLPECVLPGCTEPVVYVGDACPGCIEAFVAMLVQRSGAPMTPESIEARDADVRASYAAMRAPSTETDRKQNQRCWLCDERRTCTRVGGRWECHECLEVAS